MSRTVVGVDFPQRCFADQVRGGEFDDRERGDFLVWFANGVGDARSTLARCGRQGRASARERVGTSS
jgi:hypothetical protein